MLKEEIIFDGAVSQAYQLHAVIFKPENKPRKVLHIIHGMTEHIGRYEKLAEKMTSEGIMVVGFDLRGHGKNDGDKRCASFGENGWQASLEDIHIFYELIKQQYSDLPYYILGFSLGSFLLREYLNIYSYDRIEGAIIMGTGCQPALVLSMIMKIVKKEIHKVGYDQTTPLIQNLSFGQYNKKFKPNRTVSDWLCSDNNQLDDYIRDRLCRQDISAGLFYDLLSSMKRTGHKTAYTYWNKQMPVLLISGKNDCVGDMTKGIVAVYKLMKKAGINHLKMELIENARHDLLHEEESGAAVKAVSIIKKFIGG